MESSVWRSRKVAVVGAGAVGATFAYALAQSGYAEEIAVVDINRELAEGQVLDLSHGQPFFPSVDITVGTPEDYADAHVIVITAGASQKPGETRLDLLQKNASIMESIVDDITAQTSQAVIVVVTNPVDVLTYVAQKRAGWLRGRVIGSGTVLDSARFRYLLGEHCEVDVHNVHAYVLGEHGDSEFGAWSLTHIAGLSMDDYCAICKQCNHWEAERASIMNQVRDSAYHIIDYKGSTSFGVGMALVRIVRAILRNEHSVLTVSTVLAGEYGLNGVALSAPSIVTERGVARVLEADLSEEEMALLHTSAGVLQEAIDELEGA
jgi:L-lactate dehydrogenase